MERQKKRKKAEQQAQQHGEGAEQQMNEEDQEEIPDALQQLGIKIKETKKADLRQQLEKYGNLMKPYQKRQLMIKIQQQELLGGNNPNVELAHALDKLLEELQLEAEKPLEKVAQENLLFCISLFHNLLSIFFVYDPNYSKFTRFSLTYMQNLLALFSASFFTESLENQTVSLIVSLGVLQGTYVGFFCLGKLAEKSSIFWLIYFLSLLFFVILFSFALILQFKLKESQLELILW